MADDHERTAAFMSPAKLAQLKASKPAAAAPAAWMDGVAADAGGPHVARLAELRLQFAAQASMRDDSALLASIEPVIRALDQIDFGLLQPKGWLARATGKARSEGAEFAGQYEAAAEAASALKEQSVVFQKKAQADGPATERILVEVDVECAAVDKILEQGARWLQEMQGELKVRQAAAADDENAQKEVRSEAARCEALLQRLKILRPLAADTRQLLKLAHESAQSREALAQSLQQVLANQFRAWEAKLAPLASAAGDSSSPALDREGPLEAQKDLRARLEQAAAETRALGEREQALVAQLDALADRLNAAA